MVGRSTAFYKGVREAIEDMRRRPADESKWIVALTDGKDTDSDRSDRNAAANSLLVTPELNLALITLGEEANQPANKQGLDELIHAAQNGSHPNVGMLVPATDLEAVKAAFEQIAAEMVAPSGGAAG